MVQFQFTHHTIDFENSAPVYIIEKISLQQRVQSQEYALITHKLVHTLKGTF